MFKKQTKFNSLAMLSAAQRLNQCVKKKPDFQMASCGNYFLYLKRLLVDKINLTFSRALFSMRKVARKVFFFYPSKISSPDYFPVKYGL